MVGINLFGFRKFELLRGEGEGGGGGGPGGDDGTGATDAGNQGGLSAGTSGGVDGDLGEFGGSGPDVSAQGNVGSFDPGFAPDAQFSDEDVGLGAVSANTQNFDVSPAQQMAELGAISDSSIGAGADASGNSYFDAIETDPDKLADQVAFESVSSNVPDVIGPNSFLSNEDAAIAVETDNQLSDPFSGIVDFNTASSIADDTEVGTTSMDDAFAEQLNDPNLSSSLDLSGITMPDVSALYGGLVTPEMMSAPSQVAEDALASEALALDQGITGLLGGDPVSPVSFTATDAATTGMDINPAALAAATGIVGAGISDPTATGVQDPSGLTVDLGLTGGLEALGSSPFSVNSGGTPPNVNEIANIEAVTGLYGPDALAASTVDPGLTGAMEALGTSPFSVNSGGTPPNINEIANIEAATGLYGPDAAAASTVDTGLTGAMEALGSVTPGFDSLSAVGTGTGVDTNTTGLSDEDVDMQFDDTSTAVTADSLYGTSLVTDLPTTAMSPIEAQAMTGGSMSTTNNTGMNLAQQTNNVEATNQAEAMDVLGAQIGAGNLTGNETIDQVNIALAEQGVQIDTSGLPGILGTGVNAVNQNYQLNQNQDILTQLAQGTGNDDATNTGILGTGIGAVTDVNTYTPAYNAQGQIVGSVATDAAGNAVGGGAGITTNVVGGLGAMDDVYSDAAGTNLYGDVNEAVGDFKDMVAASQDSDEGPPQDVTSVDANGCVIGAEFFDGQKCSPIGSTVTGDATGGGTGGGFTPYNYQPGQGTMLKPDFSDLFTSKVDFSGINPNASNMNFLKPAVNPYGNFAGGGIVNMMRNNRYR